MGARTIHDLAENGVRGWSALLANHMICRECGVVDNDLSRMRVGSSCSICGETSVGGQLYYHLNIHLLIDLLEGLFYTKGDQRAKNGKWVKGVGCLIYFCTLREALIENLIVHLYSGSKIPGPVRNRLSADNRMLRDKLTKLFPALAGRDWKDAIDSAGRRVGEDFREVNAFLERAAALRNRFLHEASYHSIPEDIAEQCVNHLGMMLRLFVELHNVSVHKLPAKRGGLLQRPIS